MQGSSERSAPPPSHPLSPSKHSMPKEPQGLREHSLRTTIKETQLKYLKGMIRIAELFLEKRYERSPNYLNPYFFLSSFLLFVCFFSLTFFFFSFLSFFLFPYAFLFQFPSPSLFSLLFSNPLKRWKSLCINCLHGCGRNIKHMHKRPDIPAFLIFYF